MDTLQLLNDPTQQLLQYIDTIHQKTGDTFEAATEMMRLLGAHSRNGATEIVFWTPELTEQNIPTENTYLEVFTPPTNFDITNPDPETQFTRRTVQLVQTGDYYAGVVSGMTAGSKTQIGDFYWLRYRDHNGEWQRIIDYLAYSVPFGVFAPAEYYDIQTMLNNRQDTDHYHHALNAESEAHRDDDTPRVLPPVNMMEVHIGTASKEGTIAGLTAIYRTIADKINTDTPLEPWERNYIGYDAIQLMPIEPPIEHEAGPPFWEFNDWSPDAHSVTVTLRPHDITNWGYDVMIAASPAVNPAILSTKRPDELLELFEVLHNFPEKPIRIVFDIVYGHTDNQAVGLLNHHILAGANMYGQNLNYAHPVTRALLLEMQRRKHDYGVDGVRVDGAQDFKWWEADTDLLHHDDDYLREMNDIVQNVAGVRYRPWMIFEDGRPWPRDDWELSSTYREVTKLYPNVWQWGPLTFAHNTPFLFTFWISKWWRIREMLDYGEMWITGCANHDTLRRGTQVPTNARINTYLGETLDSIMRNAYDNMAAKLFDYAIMPGIPMDFLNANLRAPWGFIRNTDDKYGVKVVSEEANFAEWVITEATYSNPENFQRLKENWNFDHIDEVRRFLHLLDHLVQATDYNLQSIADMLNATTPPLPSTAYTPDRLKAFARDWMDDAYAYCNVTHYYERLDPDRQTFDSAVREFRRQRPWLLQNITDNDVIDYLHPTEGSITFYGFRTAPDSSEQILFIANMEGAPRTVVPADLPIPNLPLDGWQPALVTPVVRADSIQDTITLHDSQAVVFVRQP